MLGVCVCKQGNAPSGSIDQAMHCQVTGIERAWVAQIATLPRCPAGLQLPCHVAPYLSVVTLLLLSLLLQGVHCP
jgi:hypothetical protein